MAINKAWIILMLVAGLSAQTQSPATVEGTVRNLATGDPIADVRVTLTSEGSTATSNKSATTDAEGRFIIEGIPPGRYGVSATRTLFFRPRRNAGPAALTLMDGERLRGVQIFLASTGVIAGKVTDERRNALRSVRVEALRREFRDGGRVWVSAGQSTTDDRGDYRLFNLQPGAYYVRAARNNEPPLYYPAVVDSNSAVPTTVDSGNEVGGIDIEMRRTPEYAIQFKLGDIPAGSTTNFSVRRKNSAINEQQLARPEDLKDNTYKVKLPAGTWDLLVQVSTPAGVQPRVLTHAGVVSIDVGSADRDLGIVSVPQTVTVKGRIVMPEPLPSAVVPERLGLTLRALDLPAPVTFSARAPNAFGPDGSFTVSNVTRGRYQVQLTGLPPDVFLVSAREGTREVLDMGFTVTGNQNPLELTIGGTATMGSVTGTVINTLGQTVPSSSVVLVPAPDRRGNPGAFRIATADQFGSFAIRTVLAGDYKVLAWGDIEPGIYMDPEFLKNFETLGENVRVQRGGQIAVTVRVIPAQ